MAGVFFIGDWRVDPSLRTLTSSGGEVHVEPKQIQVLVLLAEHAGQVVSKERLLQNVWADTFVGDEVLSRAISELRRVLGDDAKAPRFIQTIPKGGYRLVAPVRTSDEAPATPAAPSINSRPPTLWRPTRGIVLVLLATTVVAAMVWSVVTSRSSVPSTALRMTTVPLTSLPGTEGSPSFSPDGTRVVFNWAPNGSAESRIVVKSIGDDAVQELTRGTKDSYPAWSPDGRLIAFARDDVARSGLYVVPAIGGPVRRLFAGRLYYGPGWSPDSRTLVFSATFPGPCRIFSLSLETLEARPLTSTDAWDISPAFSPDGRTIAFVRDSGYAGDLYLVPAGGGELRRLTFDDKAIDGHPTWTEDGAAILFVSSRAGSPELWRVSFAGGGSPERLPIASTAISDIALDRTGRRFAYVQGRSNGRMCMRAFDLGRPGRPPVDIMESSRSDHSPTFSNDGRRIAFASNRAGEASNIWIADADGSNTVRLTNFPKGFSGSPGWSPDGEWVAFDSRAEGQNGIFVVRVAGGVPRRLTSGRAADYAPSWSNDGRWIYFGSNRGGKDQVWKVPIAGGEALQITKLGGGRALESPDGKWIYYTKSNGQDGVWRVPPDGGDEEPVLNDLPSGWYNRYWALVENGIYYLNTRNGDRQSVEFLSFSTRKVKRLFDLPEPAGPDWSSSFAVSPDERMLLTVFITQTETDIVLVDNFQSSAVAAPR